MPASTTDSGPGDARQDSKSKNGHIRKRSSFDMLRASYEKPPDEEDPQHVQPAPSSRRFCGDTKWRSSYGNLLDSVRRKPVREHNQPRGIAVEQIPLRGASLRARSTSTSSIVLQGQPNHGKQKSSMNSVAAKNENEGYCERKRVH